MSRKIYPMLCLAACALISSDALAERFIGKVKVTLIDPATVSAQEPLSFGPIKSTPGATCSMDPETGELIGSACISSQAETAQMNINGTENLSVSINLSDGESDQVQFQPAIYNGIDEAETFQLASEVHPINLGGTVKVASTPTSANSNINYDVEVLFP